MSDLTVFAESLIATVARAFYDDEVVCLIDVLIRDKFLRDDDMAPRLQLPVKKLRATLQFLMQENLVREENVDDLHEGGSQATRFFYLDYNRAVHSIRLRLHLLRKKLEKAELQARSSSFYLCPGYKEKRCNGRYTEEEAQRVLDMNTGIFLCQECSRNYENNPNAPPMETYTLQLVDNEKDLKLAMDNLRRLNVQMSAKAIGNQQLRPGVYDLLGKVRGNKTGRSAPITSNLPSENFALGIGSTRLEGTGRTAGIKAQKMQKQGLAESSAEARKYLVGTGHGRRGGGSALGLDDAAALMFLKSAHGHEIQFTVEKGSGARAQVLASHTMTTNTGNNAGTAAGRGGSHKQRRRRKLMDTAASRVGVSLPIPLQLIQARQEQKRKTMAEKEAAAAEGGVKKRPKTVAPTVPEFLKDNIGRMPHERTLLEQRQQLENEGEEEPNGQDEENNGHAGNPNEPELVVDDELEELRQLPEVNRVAAFQAHYKSEVERQAQLLNVKDNEAIANASVGSAEEEDRFVPWEDGF